MTRKRIGKRAHPVVTLGGLIGLALVLVACQTAPAPASPEETAGSPNAEATAAAVQQQIQALQEQLQDERSQREELESQLEESLQTLDIRTAMLEGLLVEAQVMDRLQESKEDLERTVTTLRDAAEALENDRQLLIELRRDEPQGKDVALEHWRNIKALAVKSDPSLARPIDRVLSAATAYYTWFERDHTSQLEASQAYYASGADQYQLQMEEFNKAVLLTLIFRIDAIIQQTSGG